MDLIRKILSFRTLIAAGMGMGLSTACATGDMPEGRVGMSCYVDGDCPADLRCVSQMCVEPASAAMGDDDEDEDDDDESDSEEEPPKKKSKKRTSTDGGKPKSSKKQKKRA